MLNIFSRKKIELNVTTPDGTEHALLVTEGQVREFGKVLRANDRAALDAWIARNK